ncbi:BMP family ABC transporter substrate-binding protein [Streptomyces sp. ME19-01-6]|uniref:BMP family lipoprotein n=1 Tax=Streptomyces sp. ME19-01-6 TaxID=3028686 RepID=UPI0029AF851A|nr:BMP family ABC transporter substrate-binding protein [Streptomyces sp. ME19-01-6]MDX3227548.1 BMP family ABC transporter substrate-binding protein [Streptomyces sp. ME19-01-6]
MRRVSSIAVAGIGIAALAFTTTACGGSSSDSKKDKGVAIAYDVGGRGDQSFNDAAYAGYAKAKKELGVKGDAVEPSEGESQADQVQRLSDLARAGHNPVIAVGFVYAPAVKKVAKDFPKTTFGLVDDDTVHAKNVVNMVFNEEQASYLAGVAAALTTKSKTVGFVGGVENPLIKKFEAGYVQGVHDTNKSVKVKVQYLTQPPDYSGFKKPDLGKSTANGQLDAGADVIYQVAGKAGTGVIETTAARGKWVIGVDMDQYKQAGLAKVKDHILASATKGIPDAVYNLVKSVKDGKPQSGTVRYGLKTGGVGLADSNPAYKKMTKVVEAVEAAKKKIISGEIKVKTTP